MSNEYIIHANNSTNFEVLIFDFWVRPFSVKKNSNYKKNEEFKLISIWREQEKKWWNNAKHWRSNIGFTGLIISFMLIFYERVLWKKIEQLIII